MARRTVRMKGNIVPEYKALRKALLILKSVQHPIRQAIIRELTTNRTLSVSEISRIVSLKQAPTSSHLANLRRAGVVRSTRKGHIVYYSLSPERLQAIYQFIDQILIENK